jgi:hypothetical protein
MSSSTASSTAQPSLRTLEIGLVLGLLIAFGFALIIRLVPESVLTDTGPRIAVYAALGAEHSQSKRDLVR